MSRFRKNKKASKDFERSMLPQTRRAVFWDVVKLQWRKLLGAALILVISALPLLLISVYEDSYFLTLYEDPQILKENIPTLIVPLHIFCAVLSIPGILIFFLGMSGVIRVVRQLAWEENAMVFPDFMVGLRQNWKQFLPTGLLFGLGYAFAKIGWHSALAAQASSNWLQGIALGFLIFLIAPLVACCIVVNAVYENSFWGNLKLAAYIYLKSPLKAVGSMLLAFGLSVAVWVIPHLQLHLIGSIPAVIVFTLGLLGWMLFVFHQLDKYYNAEHYPALVGKGVNGH